MDLNQKNPQKTELNLQSFNNANSIDQPVSMQSTSPDSSSNENLETTKVRTIIAILLLIFLPLIGLIFVWYLTQWPKRLKKILLFLIILLPILLILLSIVFIALNPNSKSKVSSKTVNSTDKFSNLNKPSKIQNDTKRSSDVNQILNSIWIYARDNGGELPSGIKLSKLEISSDGADICENLLVQPYMENLPIDPFLNQIVINKCSKEYKTGYFVVKNNDGTVTVSAPNAESGIDISVTR